MLVAGKFVLRSGGREASCVCTLESISPSCESFLLCGNKLCASCNAFKRHIWHLGEILPDQLQLCRLSTYLLDPQEVQSEDDMHLKEQVTQKLRGKGAESLLGDKYVSKQCALASLLNDNSALQQCVQAKAKRKKQKSVPLL